MGRVVMQHRLTCLRDRPLLDPESWAASSGHAPRALAWCADCGRYNELAADLAVALAPNMMRQGHWHAWETSASLRTGSSTTQPKSDCFAQDASSLYAGREEWSSEIPSKLSSRPFCAKILLHMDLYIIRHAQSTNNALPDERARVCDPHLTELGRRQAELLAGHLATGRDLHPQPTRAWNAPPSANGRGGYGIQRLYTSAMRRALQTAWPIGQALGVQPAVWLDIHEHGGIWLDHGEGVGIRGYGGITRSELAAEFPGYVTPDEITEAGWWRGAHEELWAAEARAARVAATLRSWGQRDEKIAIITHGAFATSLLRALLGEPTAQPVFYHLDNASISLVRFRRDNELSVRYLNRLDHLPAELIT